MNPDDWPWWWTMPLLIFSGITGPGGYRILTDRQAELINDAPSLYFALWGAVSFANCLLAIGVVAAVIWLIGRVSR